ncbi:MAG: anti-sigma regulatory factor [Planctomycetaceae bacterium]|jgi:serine/threonine-protein kinase RsbW|nr:anti-sigma regulatory factor [Planctomycetaceae bacterium]
MTSTSDFAISVPSDTSQARQVQDRIIELLEKREFSERDLFGVRLALEEALVNAIKHGNGMDPTKQVYVDCQFTDDRVRIVIQDEGGGFDSSTVPDPTAEENLDKPGGRGIMLMKAFMSHVEYNDVGNRLLLEKLRDEPEEDDD